MNLLFPAWSVVEGSGEVGEDGSGVVDAGAGYASAGSAGKG